MKVIFLEDDGLRGFGPVALLRHLGTLRRGTKTLVEALAEKIPDATDVGLWGRPELSAVTRASTGREYNGTASGQTLLVNARAVPNTDLVSLVSRQGPFVAIAGSALVAARVDTTEIKAGPVTSKAVAKLARAAPRVEAGPGSLFDGYWDLVESNGLAIAEQARRREDTMAVPRSVEVRGPASNVMVDSGADIEGHVTLDARLGPVVVGEGASVESFSRLMGPCYIGPRTRVYSAQIGGGTSIFDSCKVGGQVENSVILPYTNKAHHGYVGDAYVGSWVNLGAGSTFGNLKNTYGNVRLSVGGKKVDSGMVKLGPAIGDMAKVSIGAMVYSGRLIGAGSHVSGLARDNVPDFTFFDSEGRGMVELHLESIIETQRRMMERRGMLLSREEEAMIRRAFVATSPERRKARVKKGRLI